MGTPAPKRLAKQISMTVQKRPTGLINPLPHPASKLRKGLDKLHRKAGGRCFRIWRGENISCQTNSHLSEMPSVLLKNEKSAQRGSFRDGYPVDIRGSFARISRVKTSVRALETLENKHFGADIHDPKARTSTTLRGFQELRSEKLWAEFSFPNCWEFHDQL